MAKVIRFGEPVEAEVPIAPQPSTNLLMANLVQNHDPLVQVYFVKGIHNKILSHINETPRIESGGVLVGHPFRSQEDSNIFVVVTGAIPQHSRNRGVAHFTVGPEETAVVRQEIEERYPGQVSVGWYHSHPGHGVFLSGQDMVIVSNIYNASWHIALVIDPSRNEEGLFIGPNGSQIGPPGGQKFGTSWVELSKIPDSLRAIAFFNEAKDAFDGGRTHDAKRTLDDLAHLIEDSEELSYWQDAPQLTKLKTEVAESVNNATIAESPEIGIDGPGYSSPEPSRPPANPTLLWLLVSAGCTFAFAVTLLMIAFFFQETSVTIVTNWGILLSAVAVVCAGYAIFSRPNNNHANSNSTKLETRISSKALVHQIFPLGIISIVFILWCIYIDLSSDIYSNTAILKGDKVNKNITPKIEVISTSVPQTPAILKTKGAPPHTKPVVTVTFSNADQDGMKDSLIDNTSSIFTLTLTPTRAYLLVEPVTQTMQTTTTMDLSNINIFTSSAHIVTNVITDQNNSE